MIPAFTALMISSARSAACGFSIFAITGMSEPPVRTRRSTGCQVLGAADERDREQVDAVLDREVDPVEVLAPGGRQRDLGARAG